MLPVIAARVSLSPPKEMAFRMASLKSVLSRNAIMACGTVSWQVSLKGTSCSSSYLLRSGETPFASHQRLFLFEKATSSNAAQQQSHRFCLISIASARMAYTSRTIKRMMIAAFNNCTKISIVSSQLILRGIMYCTSMSMPPGSFASLLQV